jgi:excisionase family DNA binding protein
VAADGSVEYLTIDQAARVFGVSQATVRRILRAYGLGEFVRGSMRREVLVSRRDFEAILRSLPWSQRGAA